MVAARADRRPRAGRRATPGRTTTTDDHHDRGRRRRDRRRRGVDRRAPQRSAPAAGRASALVVAYSHPLLGARLSPLPDVMPWGVVAQGVIFGTSYALLAMGLILIYRTTRIVNFAYGAMGAMPGSLTVGLFVAKGWNYWLAIARRRRRRRAHPAPLIDILVIRRFARVVPPRAHRGHDRPGPDPRRHRPHHRRRPRHRRADRQHRHPAQRQLLHPALPDPRRPPAHARRGPGGPRPGSAGSCSAPTPGGPCGPRPRTRTGPCCSACRCAACRRSCGRSPAAWPPSPSSPRRRSPASCPSALVGRHGHPPGPGRGRDRPLPVAADGAVPAASASASPSGRSAGTCSAESIFDVTFLVVILVVLLLRARPLHAGPRPARAAGTAPACSSRSPSCSATCPRCAGRGAASPCVAAVRRRRSCRSTLSPSTVTTLSFALVWGARGHVARGAHRLGRQHQPRPVRHRRASAPWPPATSSRGGTSTCSWRMAVADGGRRASWRWPSGSRPCASVASTWPSPRIAFAVALDSYFLNPVNFSELRARQHARPRCCGSGSTWTASGCATSSAWPSSRWPRSSCGPCAASRPGRVMIATRDNERAAGALAVPTTWVKLQTFVFSGCARRAGRRALRARAHAGRRRARAPSRPASSIEVFSYAVIGGLGSVAGAISGVFFFRLLDFVLAKQFSGQVGHDPALSLSGAGLLLILYFLPGGLWQFVQRRRDRSCAGSPSGAASSCRASWPTGGSTDAGRTDADDDHRRGRDRA